MHRPLSMVSTAIASNLVYRKGIKVQAGTKIRDRPLCRVLPHSKFSHCQSMHEPHNNVNIESHLSPASLLVVGTQQRWTGRVSGVAK